MINLMLTLILLAVVGGAALYIYKARKRGVSCIGCPDAKRCKTANGECSADCRGCCGRSEQP